MNIFPTIKRFFLVFLLVSGGIVWFAGVAGAAEINEVLPPPVISFYNRSISNEEIFYISGVASLPKADVIIYFQKEDGSLLSYTVQTDNLGRWFYSHPNFLAKGHYTIWTQLKADMLISPPSPQVNITVETTALQIGTFKIGFELLYAISSISAILLSLVLLGYIIYHFRQHTRKNLLMMKEITKAEVMVHYGFLDLRKDITNELAAIRQGNLSAVNLREREVELLRHLEEVEGYFEKQLAQMEGGRQN